MQQRIKENKLKRVIFKKSTINQLILLSAATAAIWIIGLFYAPLSSVEKRIYLTLLVYLCWLLKFVLVAPAKTRTIDNQAQQKLNQLSLHFKGAMQFLKTSIAKQGKKIRLGALPCFLLVGLRQGGKTSLVAHSGMPFLLQRRFQETKESAHNHQQPASEHCDWWITREASIIDIPGKLLSDRPAPEEDTQKKKNFYPLLWRSFLRLMKKYRGKNAIKGLIIALPLPEIMKQLQTKKTDLKQYHSALAYLFKRISELEDIFRSDIPCHLVITKCDLLTGFSDFFAESSQEEISQSWGINLPYPESHETVEDVFINRFNALIKKLNQQLIWRLHQERNPTARPYIKDFPLQVERLKEFIADFITRLSEKNTHLTVKGVYLTSALQPEEETTDQVIPQSAQNQQSLQLFKAPSPQTRAYFIKQFLNNQLPSLCGSTITEKRFLLKHYTAFAISFCAVAMAILIFGQDFKHGMEQSYLVENTLATYRLNASYPHSPSERLSDAVSLLDFLDSVSRPSTSPLRAFHVLSFYSQEAQQRNLALYQKTLHSVLLPEIKNYLSSRLEGETTHQNPRYLYASLEAYLMLGNPAHAKPAYIAITLKNLLNGTMSPEKINHLVSHTLLAFHAFWEPLLLNDALINETRRHLASLSNEQLAYVILENMNNNNENSYLHLGWEMQQQTPVFTHSQESRLIPYMYTAKAFPVVLSQQINVSAEEVLLGNWVLSTDYRGYKNPVLLNKLVEQLRVMYINNYINAWEKLLDDIQLAAPTTLAQLDKMIITLTSDQSPLLQLLQTLRENTNFNVITATNPRLLDLNTLTEKNKPTEIQLAQMLINLKALHQYLQKILVATDQQKAAFEAVKFIASDRSTPDVLTQLRLSAINFPKPVKSWIESVADNTWHFLVEESGRYLNTAWRTQVFHPYKADIASRYPFNVKSNEEVDIKTFTSFFGNPGAVVSFYDNYLQPFVDTKNAEWRWKKIEGFPLPLTEDALRQIQQAMHVHDTFFPKNDATLSVAFSLQPYEFSNRIKSVKLSINDKNFLDMRSGNKTPHMVTWPNNNKSKLTSVELTMVNDQTMSRDFPGDWGLFRLMNESYESMLSKKAILVNVSMNQNKATYVLSSTEKVNPLLSLNLNHFVLPQQLTT
ncbi:MAG TPA: type VI secretion system membrane subunit TssM [Gammaproteobacteria bacterium]|jgi:type VI secretion system protein ImpL|nr:type VI secretion system membrane subunit TssM [Gammaproteobacteria bacterium]